MNVVVSNEKKDLLSSLDIDIIKSISGTYNATDIVSMFKSFFYNKMILDVTALNNYKDLQTYEELAKGLDPTKIIFLLPENSSLCTPNFLSQLITLGIYNFTTSVDGIKYLFKKPNTLESVEHIQKLAIKNSIINRDNNTTNNTNTFNNENNVRNENNVEENVKVTGKVSDGVTIIGFSDVTDGAGATTLIYMLRKELSYIYGNEHVVGVELDKNDFSIFRDKNLFTIKSGEMNSFIEKHKNISIILVDLNKCKDTKFCNDVLYLLEPSTIKLNNLVMRNNMVFDLLKNKKIILNKSLLSSNDVSDFETETGLRVFYNMPPLDERKKNSILNEFLSKLGLVNSNSSNSNRIFGLFRR